MHILCKCFPSLHQTCFKLLLLFECDLCISDHLIYLFFYCVNYYVFLYTFFSHLFFFFRWYYYYPYRLCITNFFFTSKFPKNTKKLYFTYSRGCCTKIPSMPSLVRLLHGFRDGLALSTNTSITRHSLSLSNRVVISLSWNKLGVGKDSISLLVHSGQKPSILVCSFHFSLFTLPLSTINPLEDGYVL